MSRPREPDAIHLRSARMLDVGTGRGRGARQSADRRRAHRRGVAGLGAAPEAVAIDLGDLTLLPGLMDMEVNLLHGRARPPQPADPGAGRPGGADPAGRGQRPTDPAGRVHHRAQPRALRADRRAPLDVALKKAIDLGWIDGPRVVPAGHAITPTGGHLDPTMFQAFAPHVMPLTVEEGIADGVSEVRKAVRYQIKYGAKLIKVCASGGVMSHTGPGRLPSSTPTRSCGPSPTKRTGPGCGWRPTPTATTASGPRSKPASTASSTDRS